VSAADGNLFTDVPCRSPEELVSILLARDGVQVERIVSTGQASPPGFWYDQPWTEWVALISGAASLRFEDEPAPRELRPGDHLLIAPHRRHRIVWTDPDRPTIWLALHLRADSRQER
jgi:cupin 2 domain-containing protein